MSLPDYRYTVEQCDVPESQRAALADFRRFRLDCLESLRGDSDTSVAAQVHDLTWHTVVFRTLNHARRLIQEDNRAVFACASGRPEKGRPACS